ncbi:hypothetical protein [Brevibacillus sp. 1238]|uniref:hypothetical protein n=1 Tax=Brevibacillus sp. 1238 TaxID=2940565 RepID=UPI0024753645|nr:hypothetical protein [Brevibacillus sp. 1238]MDH6351883.1 hypothetical protein [Brevibacillus sp. 1238]
MAAEIPQHLLQSRHWRSLIYLFQNHPKLQGYFNTKYFDLHAERVKAQALKRESKPWSDSERFMLDLALHLFNDSNKVDLGGMDYLDHNNTRLALKAIELRYS